MHLEHHEIKNRTKEAMNSEILNHVREGKHFTAPPGLIRLQSLPQDLCRNMELASNLKQKVSCVVLHHFQFTILDFFIYIFIFMQCINSGNSAAEYCSTAEL